MQALRHVSSAIDHADRLADEADELGAPSLADELRDRGRHLAGLLEDALAALDRVGPAKELRQRAHAALGGVYAEITLDLARVLPPEEAGRLSPGGHLDVAERARFRLRRLLAKDLALAPLAARLQAALGSYDKAVDAYLLASAEAASAQEAAVCESQRFRLDLERAKLQLLSRAEVGSEVYQRIKRRAVRTKRARWLQAEARELPRAA